MNASDVALRLKAALVPACRAARRSVAAARAWAVRAHPVTLAGVGFVGLTVVLVTLQWARAANGPAASAGAPTAVQLTSLFGNSRLPDGRTDTSQVRWDNLLITPIPGWTKRGQEWGGQWTLEGPEFKTKRFQITGYVAVSLDEKGLAGLADAQYKSDRNYIDFKEEAPRVEGVHPAGYKTLTTLTSVKATGYGQDARLYSLHVYLEANGLASHLQYAAAYRENFDLHRPTFEAFLRNLRLLSGQTLAPAFDDQPPLEQFTVNQCCDFLEWLLDVPLTDTQREAARDHLTRAWERKDKEEAKGLWEVFAGRNELDKLDKAKKELGRVAARNEVIKTWRDEAAKGDAMAKLMVDIYDRAHQPLAQGNAGEPPLTRQRADATLEILHFMASKVAGFDVGPTEQQKAEFAKELAAKYASLDAAAKTEVEQMPLYWAWFRAAWPELPAEERTKLVGQWGADERIKPIVGRVQELRAKAIASGNDPSGQLKAMRKLYQQQQTVAHISNMMAMQHRTNMMVINNIGSSNYRYEYKYVYRYR
jgi:hypothetical protein